MFGTWAVESVVHFSSNGVATMEKIGASTRAADVQLGRLTGQITAQEAAWLRYEAQLNRTRLAHHRLIEQLATGVTIVGVAAIGYSIDRAAKLQQILASIKNETGASGSQLGSIYNDIFNIGNRSGMNPIEAGEIWRTVSRLTAGQMTIAQMRSIAPFVADFASMVHFNRPDIDVNQAAMVGLSTSHLFRAYTEGALRPLLDKVYRLSGLMAETPDQALRQMSYYEPMFKGLGVDSNTSVAMMALLDRAGFRNKVGTNVRAMMLEALGPLQTTQFAQGGKLALLQSMGLFRNGKFAFNNADGSVNFMGVLGQLASWEHMQRLHGVSRGELTKELYGVFGRQGGTIASLMSDPTMVAFLGQITKYLHDPNVSLQAGMRNRDASLGFQFGRAVANLDAVFVELGYPWLDDLSKFFKALADDAHDLQAFLHGHRDIEKTIGGVVGMITTVAGAMVAVGLVSRGLVFLGILQTMPNAFLMAIAPLRILTAGLWTMSGGAAAASLGMRGFAMSLWALAAPAGPLAAVLAMMATLYWANQQRDQHQAIFGSAGGGEMNGPDAYYLRYARRNGWFMLPQSVRKKLYDEGYRVNTAHGSDRSVYHIVVNNHGVSAKDSAAVRKATHDGVNDARRAAGANHSQYQTSPQKPLAHSVPPQ
jgi:TP901 family phage tail tape measure protein